MFDKEKLTLSVMANHYYHNNHSFMRDTDPDRNCSFFNKQQTMNIILMILLTSLICFL